MRDRRCSIPSQGIGGRLVRGYRAAAMNTVELTRSRRAKSDGSAFGRLLKEWRGRRGFSQLGLAVAARTTQRHLSFIESGRAVPSRDMVLRLGTTMSVPLRQQNAMLLAAGYAPAWQERDLSTPDLAAVNSALDYMLAHHEPYPAFVVDRCWNLLRQSRRREPDRISDRSSASGHPVRAGQSGGGIGIPGRIAAVYRQLAGSNSLLSPR